QSILVGTLAGHDLAAPAFLHVLEQINAILFFVGIDNVIAAIAIEVDEPESGIIALGITKQCPFRNGKRQLDPSALVRGPTQDGWRFFVADDQLALAVPIQVAKTQTTAPGEINNRFSPLG